MYTCFKGYTNSDKEYFLKGGNYKEYQDCLKEAQESISGGFDWVHIMRVDSYRVQVVITLRGGE